MGNFQFDTTQWPLVLFLAEGSIEGKALDDHFAEYRKLLDRNKPYVILMDTTKMGSTNAIFRKRYAEFFKENNDDLQRLCKGGAIIITSAVIRGTLTAVLWLSPMPFPHKTFATKEEAIPWLKGQMDKL